jgi:hypothetical protein
MPMNPLKILMIEDHAQVRLLLRVSLGEVVALGAKDKRIVLATQHARLGPCFATTFKRTILALHEPDGRQVYSFTSCFSIGSSTMNVVPSPVTVSNRMLPPCC